MKVLVRKVRVHRTPNKGPFSSSPRKHIWAFLSIVTFDRSRPRREQSQLTPEHGNWDERSALCWDSVGESVSSGFSGPLRAGGGEAEVRVQCSLLAMMWGESQVTHTAAIHGLELSLVIILITVRSCLCVCYPACVCVFVPLSVCVYSSTYVYMCLWVYVPVCGWVCHSACLCLWVGLHLCVCACVWDRKSVV